MGASLSVDDRLSVLETRMTALEQLPARMERLETRIDRLESDLRAEIRAGDEETRRVLRQEMREGNVMIVTALTEQIEESRRYARVLHEETLGRIGLLGEAFAGLDGKFTALGGEFGLLNGKHGVLDNRFSALDVKFTALDGKVGALDGRMTALDGKVTALDGKFDTAQTENRAMFERILAAIESPRTPRTRKRR